MDDIYIAKVCNGDTDAFRYFIKTYQEMAFNVAIAVVKDEYTAQEIVQDAFVKAFKGLSSFSKRSGFRTWFYRIVVNEALQRLRKRNADLLVLNETYDTQIADEHVILALQEAERAWLVSEALKVLAPNEALALRLFYLEEESIKAVCEITGWTEANTKVILHRARKNMLAVVTKIMKQSA